MKKTVKPINEQVKLNTPIATRVAKCIFYEFPYIKSVNICIGTDGNCDANAEFARKGETKCISEYISEDGKIIRPSAE